MISIFIILIVVNNFSYGRYYRKVSSKYDGMIAEPIVKVQKVSQKIIENNYTKNTSSMEYIFDIKNYYTDENANKKISEVDFGYLISIKETNPNFPVRYELYDMESGEELLNNGLATSKKTIFKNNEYSKRYKLIAIWNSDKVLSGNLDEVAIEVEIVQGKKGVLA